MILKYTGWAQSRSFTKTDLERHGIEVEGALRFDVTNNFLQEVSDEAGEAIIALEGASEFREATEDDLEYEDMSRVGSYEGQWVKNPDGSKREGAIRRRRDSMQSPSIEGVSASPGAVETGAGTGGRTGGRSTGRGRA